MKLKLNMSAMMEFENSKSFVQEIFQKRTPGFFLFVLLFFVNSPFVRSEDSRFSEKAWYALLSKPLVLVFDSMTGQTWYEFEIAIESLHPYPRGTSQELIEMEGVRGMQYYFSEIKFEEDYDYLSIFDSSDRKVAEWTGNQDNFWTEKFQGSKFRFEISTDYSVERFGYAISRLRILL